MAYHHTQYEVVVAQGQSLNSAADIGTWGPSLVPHIIRMAGLVIRNDVAAAGVVKIDLRVTAGSDTGRGDGDVATFNLTTAHTGGKIVYVDGIDVTVQPGQEVVFEVTDVTGSGDTADLILMVEPSWERPANISAMVASA